MKKLLSSILLMSVGAANVMAQNDNLNNTLYVEDCSAIRGQAVTLSVKMKNTAHVQTLGTYITLPQGFSIAYDADKNGYDVQLSTERTSAADHVLASNMVDDSYRVAILGVTGKSFADTDGEVMTLELKVADNVEPGNYEMVLSNMELIDTDNIAYRTDSQKFLIHVAEVSGIDDTLLTGDDNSAAYGIDGVRKQKADKGIVVKGGDKVLRF